LTAVAYFNFRFRKKTSKIWALIKLSSTINTLIGGITPIVEFFVGTVSFSFALTRGFTLGGNGDSVRSATGEGDRGFVITGIPWPEMVLLFRRVTGEVDGPPWPLLEELPDPGDFGDVVPFGWICGLSVAVMGDEVVAVEIIGRAVVLPWDRRVCWG
jgi:hypothetical protein